MRKLGLVAGLLALFLVVVPFQAKVCLGGDSYQIVINDTWANYLGFEQASGGWNFMEIGSTNLAVVDLRNSLIVGLFSWSGVSGTASNSFAGTMLNIDVINVLPPLTVVGSVSLANNQVLISDYNFSSTLMTDGLHGGGLLAFGMNVGPLNNQFTSLSVYIGRTLLTQPSTTNVILGTGNVNFAALTNSQLQAVAATANNDIILQGKQQATAITTGNGIQNFSGLVAITNSAGAGNQIINNMTLQVTTGK